MNKVVTTKYLYKFLSQEDDSVKYRLSEHGFNHQDYIVENGETYNLISVEKVLSVHEQNWGYLLGQSGLRREYFNRFENFQIIPYIYSKLLKPFMLQE